MNGRVASAKSVETDPKRTLGRPGVLLLLGPEGRLRPSPNSGICRRLAAPIWPKCGTAAAFLKLCTFAPRVLASAGAATAGAA